jgi:hypothetical protein
MFTRQHTHGPARSINLTQQTGPAVNLTKLRAGHVSLAKRADKAGAALSKRDLAGIRAQAVMLLDHSGSMYKDYATGQVQALVERALGFALQIDADGEIPVIRFDSKLWPAHTITTSNYLDATDDLWQPNRMGSTRLDLALNAVRDMAESTDQPLFVLVVTDGNPDDRQAATRLVVDLARYPVFLKFLALRGVSYLRDLDDLDRSRRLVDNVDTKVFPTLAGVTDMQFAEAMADEWDSWFRAASAAGILA